MFEIFTIDTCGVKKRRPSFFKMDSVLRQVADGLLEVPLEHLLCIYESMGRLQADRVLPYEG